jgi:hypothetical protein
MRRGTIATDNGRVNDVETAIRWPYRKSNGGFGRVLSAEQGSYGREEKRSITTQLNQKAQMILVRVNIVPATRWPVSPLYRKAKEGAALEDE